MRLKLLSRIAVAAIVVLAMPVAASAQCGDSVTVVLGDTLFEIAQRCNTTVDALVRANPEITNPNVIHVGQTISMPGGTADQVVERPPAQPDRAQRTYEVRPGDYLSAIARRFGTTLQRILDLNPDIGNPNILEIGEIIRLPIPGDTTPDRPRTANIEISPQRGRPGETIRVLGERFPPNTTIEIGAGPPFSEYDIIATTRTDRRGNFDTRVTMPRIPPGQHEEYVIVARTGPRGIERQATFNFAPPRDENRIEVAGVVTGEGVECPAIRSDDGQIYTLTGVDRDRLNEGDRVRVEGTVAEVSICMQGTTVRVSSLTRSGTDTGDGNLQPVVRVTGTVTGEGVECPAIRAENGRLYTLAGEVDGIEEGDRVYVEGTVAEASFCMQGTTLNVTRLEDRG